MRTLFLSLLCLFGALTVLQAQDSSYGIAYQAVARDADGDPLADVELGVRVTLRDADGNSLWQEEHASVLTNSFGNIALTIGEGAGALGSGSLGDIDWSVAGLHFQIEVNAGAGYASFGDVDVQAVPVALYAAGGWEGDVDALYAAIDEVDGDLTTFVGEANAALSTLQGDVAANATAISDEAQTRADEDAALLGLIQANDGEIAILQSSTASNTADLGDILTVFTFNGNTATIGEEGTLVIDGTLDLSGGSFSAGTGLFNYLSASNADFEEMSAESGLFEDLRFFNGRGFGPDSHLDLDGTLNVDGDATFNGSVSGTDGELASQNYVDGAVAAEAAARANADDAIQADVDQNEADSDAAEAQLQLNIDAEAAARANADDAIQADVDQNEADSDAADADLQGQINDNEFRIGAAAADMGFVTTTVGGVDNTPAHPGYDGTNYLDGESTLVGADEALDAALKAEADRAMAAEGENAADIAQNASDIEGNLAAIQSNDGDISDLQTALQDEIDRATGAESAIQLDVDQNQTASEQADADLQDNIDAVQLDVDQNQTASEEADAALQDNIDAEASAREDADDELQADIDLNEEASDLADAALAQDIADEAEAREIADNNLQGQIDSNDIEIADLQVGLQTEISQRILAQGIMNTAIQNNQGAIVAEETARMSEDDILLDLINELQGDVVDGGVVDAYFDHAGSSVDFNDAMFSEIDMNEGDLVGVGNIVADQMDAAIIDVDDAAIQNLDVESNLTAEAASVSNLLTTQEFRVFGDSQMDGDLSVAGAVDFESTLTVAGETTLNDNTVINGDLTVNGNVTAYEATMNSHLPTYGQVNFIADTLQDNIDDEEAARIAADNNLQSQITSNDDDITALQGRMDTAETDIDNLEGRMDTAETDVDNLEGRMDTAETDVDNLEGRMDTAETDIDNLEGRMDTAEGEIDVLQSDVVTISDSLQANIDDEAAARMAADIEISDSLQANINDEATARFDADSNLQTQITSNDNDISGLDTRVTANEGDIDNLEGRMDTAETDIDQLQSDVVTIADSLQENINDEEAARIAADILISDTLQENIDDERARAMAREAELQSELDATQTGAGLNPDGSYSASSARWIDDATSLTNADDQLSAVVDSIEMNLWWNMADDVYSEGESEIFLDPGIGNLDINNTDIHARSIWADGVHTDYVGTELIVADEAILEEVSTDDLNAGVADIGTLRWTHGRAVGSSSTTDLDGTLNVDGRATFRSNVYLDSNLYVDMDLFVDDAYGDTLDFNYAEIDKLATDTITNLTDAGLVLKSNEDIHLYADSSDFEAWFDDLYFYGAGQDGTAATYFEMEADNDDEADIYLKTSNDSGYSELWLDVDEDGDDADGELAAFADNYMANMHVESESGAQANANLYASDQESGEVEFYAEYDESDNSTLRMGTAGDNGDGGVVVLGYNAADSIRVNIDADILEVSAPADFNESVNVDGATTLNSTLDVDGASTLNSTLDVDGLTTLNDSLHVDLGAGFGDDIWVAGNSDVAGNSQVDGGLNVDGATTLNSTLDVDGASTLNSTLDVDGLTTLNDSLHVDLGAGFGDDIWVAGNSQVDGGLNVDGATTLNSTLDVDGASTLNSTLDVDGLTTLNDSLHVDLGAGFGDDIWVAGNSNVAGNSQVDGGLNVDGATTLNSTLDVDGATTLNSTLDVDGHTELNDSLHVDGSADIDGNLNVDGTLDAGTTDIDGSLDVSGHTELNDSLHVDGSADIDGNLNVDGTLDAGTTDIDGTLDVSGHTELNDSLHVDLSVGIDQNLWVGGNTDITGTLHVVDSAQFDSNVNIDATLTSDSVIVEESMKIYTPTYEDYSFTSETLSEPEFEILNVDGDPIFEVDGHNDDVIAENLTVNGIFTTQDWIVNDDISCDGLSAAGVVTSGNNNYGSEWGTANQNQNNWLTRRDYVDFHRQAATGVLQAFSYDADLIATSTGDTDYNESVYYMDGDLVLYADSVDVSAKNYVITVKGTNFNSLVDEDGADLTIEAAIWAENNKLDITSASHNLSVVDDNTITFEIGYADINGIVACTSGKVRPTLALGSATYGMQMTGLHFFIELEEAPAP
jgi:cytoskeletal protein CcmA (bactofilin family)/peptidoglycan hydrolase CwlO-like protein